MRRVLWLVLGVLLGALLAGCTELPADGPVQTRRVADSGDGEALIDYTPPGPRVGSAPVPLVDDWLTAMTATPLSTIVAREFLTAGSSRSWVPERGTIVYGSQQLVARAGGMVVLRLRDVVELDDRGAWRGDPTGGRGHDIALRLVREGSQWRINRPPNRLLIPRRQLESQYQQLSLYFFDRSAEVLVPEPVYVPRGPQAPTLLLSGLLKGPASRLGEVERTFLPAGTVLDGISVPVSRTGTAEVPLSAQVLDVDEPQLTMMLAQVAWTLGQVPGVQRLRVTVDGSPLDPPGSRGDVGVGDFSKYDPSVAWASTDLFGVRGRRVVALGSDEQRVSGPFGALPLGPRWIAVDPLAQHVAGVTADGRTVLDSDRDGVPGRGARMSDLRTVYPGGTDVLRPAYDLYGALWVVDRTLAGARLSVVSGRSTTPVTAPGLTGADVSRFLVSRDGTRLVAEVRSGGRDSLLLARVRRDTKGRVLGLLPARRLRVDGAPAVIRDIAWRTPTDLAVLVSPSRGVSDVLLVTIDGSSTAAGIAANAARFDGPAVRLITSPSRGAPLYLATTSGRLYALSSRGWWNDSGIAAGLRAATFVG